jgi:HK97 family phage prohead protease
MNKVFFASLTKVKDADDDTLEVHGIASTESPDSTGETILASAIRKALPAYRKYPAIREMHGLSAAGRAIEIDVDDDGVTHVVAKIVDANAIKKVKNKVYGGFSVGGRVLKRNAKDRTIIEEIELCEVSLVDRPAHPEARISLWKAAGADPADPVLRANTLLDAADAAIAKVRQPDSASEILKIINSQNDEITRLRKRVDELLAEPAPPKTAGAFGLMAISKEQDAGGAGIQKREASEDDLVAALGAMSEEERAILLIKAAQRLPRPVTMRPAE